MATCKQVMHQLRIDVRFAGSGWRHVLVCAGMASVADMTGSRGILSRGHTPVLLCTQKGIRTAPSRSRLARACTHEPTIMSHTFDFRPQIEQVRDQVGNKY